MHRRNNMIEENDVSLSTINEEDDNEIELCSDVEVIEELSDEAKRMQERALVSAREQAIAVIDRKKLPMALKEIESIEMYADILNDPEVINKVKDNTKSAMDLKFIAEAQKIKLQNLQTLLRMDSVNTEGNAGAVYVDVKFGETGGSTKIIVGNSNG